MYTRLLLVYILVQLITVADNQVAADTEDPLIAKADASEEGDSPEDDQPDDDPIDEDLQKVDLSKLSVLSRERQKNSQCEFLEEEIVKYSYEAKTRSGARTPITLFEIVNLPTEVTLINVTNPHFPGIVEYIRLAPYLTCYEQDDQLILQEIKSLLVEPSKEEYNFGNLQENINGEVGQPAEVDNLVFGGKLKNGFFIEAGSQDCEKNSDSLYYEINHGWTGLLIEPIPYLYGKCKQKNRKASLLQTCLATETKSQMVEFDLTGVWRDGDDNLSMGGIVTDDRNTSIKMQCFPLYSILLSIGNPTVNYFSLDIEGAEFAVLKTVPWDKVDIQVWSVETHMLGSMFPGSREELIQYMNSVGYTHVEGAHKGTNEIRERIGTTDDLFVKNGIEILQIKDEL